MNINILLFITILFVVLILGIILTLPNIKTDKYIVALIHGIIFAIIINFSDSLFNLLQEIFYSHE